jgi:quercetin dioxygenase-like cupin family protein
MVRCHGRIAPLKSWSLTQIETPGGSRSPVVLCSGDEGRAVLIGLEPGQQLGEHQVKESAFVVVVEGSVRAESGTDGIDAGPGTLLTFEPDERRSIASNGGARILLLFAPWPGPGHFRAEEQDQARR